MQFFALLTLAVAPGLFLLAYVYLRDRYEREPLGLVLRTFAVGVLAGLPVLVVGTWVVEPLQAALRLGPLATTIWEAFISAGLLEEFFKLLAVWWVAYRSPHFNEPYDGIVYAATAALGFATLENILYVFEGGLPTGIGRAMLSVPGHALYGIIMGYYLGIARFARGWHRSSAWLLALIAPFLLHGAYDVLVMNAEYALAAYLLYPLVAYLWVRGTQGMTRHLEASPFRTRGRVPADGALLGGPCPACGQRLVIGSAFCHHCGAPQPAPGAPEAH